MNKYFRITAYHAGEDMCCIIDSYGIFEKQFQFTFYLYDRGFEILHVSDEDKFLDVNISRTDYDPDKMALRAYMKGRPIETTAMVNGVKYQAVMVEDKVYVPNKYHRI